VRVAFVIQTFHPVVGGSERQLLALLPKLMARGVQPCVITRGLKGQASSEVLDGVPVYRCGSNRSGPLGSLMFLLGALVQLRRFKPDLVHVFSLMTPATIGMLYRRFAGVPMVVKALRGGKLGDLDRIRDKPLFAWRCRQLSRNIDAAQVISDEIDAEFASIGVASAQRFRIRNGVDIKTATTAQQPSVLDKLMSEAAACTVFLFVGRLVPEKRIELLIEAFEMIGERYADIRLWIVGDGPERENILKRIARDERMVSFGEVSNVPDFLNAATVYVQPSSTEGMSNSLLEAMACGRTVIASDVGAARELLGDNERGWLIEPDDSLALQEAMLEVLEGADNGERAQQAQAHMTRYFSLESVAENHEL